MARTRPRQRPAQLAVMVVVFPLLLAGLVTRDEVLLAVGMIGIGLLGVIYGLQLQAGEDRSHEAAGSLVGLGLSKVPFPAARVVWVLLGVGIMAIGTIGLVSALS